MSEKTVLVGELTAGTAAKKVSEEKCLTCGATGKLSPGGYCWNVAECATRRQMRASGAQNLRHPCIVKLFTCGATYYLREFGQKRSPAPLVLQPGFTAKDYEPDPNARYYEAILEKNNATSFSVADAVRLAKAFDGVAANK